MIAVLLRSWLRGQVTASIPTPGDSTLAAIACIEWKNFKPHLTGCIARLMLRRAEYDRGVDYTPIHPRNGWKVDWKKTRLESVQLLESVSASVPMEVQEMLKLGVAAFALREARRAKDRKTEAQNKSGEARPSSTEIQPTGELPGLVGSAASTESQYLHPDGKANSSSTLTTTGPPSTEFQPSAPSLKEVQSFRGTKLCTAEAVKLLKSDAPAEIQREAVAHIRALGIEEKRNFCHTLPWTDSDESLRRRVREFVVGKEWINFAGQWTNAIKLDFEKVRAMMNERDAMQREDREGMIHKSEGSRLFDLLRRFSPLIRSWYPKPDDEQGVPELSPAWNESKPPAKVAPGHQATPAHMSQDTPEYMAAVAAFKQGNKAVLGPAANSERHAE